jgi:hypothetical protein
MKSIIDLFSGKVYTKTDSMLINQEGNVFVKSGDNYIGSDGTLITQFGSTLFNTKTGTSSNFGDPFLEDNE